MNIDALHSLTDCRGFLLEAIADADNAREQLAGARHARAGELIVLIEDAIAFVERLKFVVTGDLRCE